MYGRTGGARHRDPKGEVEDMEIEVDPTQDSETGRREAGPINGSRSPSPDNLAPQENPDALVPRLREDLQAVSYALHSPTPGGAVESDDVGICR